MPGPKAYRAIVFPQNSRILVNNVAKVVLILAKTNFWAFALSSMTVSESSFWQGA